MLVRTRFLKTLWMDFTLRRSTLCEMQDVSSFDLSVHHESPDKTKKTPTHVDRFDVADLHIGPSYRLVDPPVCQSTFKV